MLSIQQADIPQLKEAYLDAILRGDATKASGVVSRALSLGIEIGAIYLDILMPSQVAVGEQWILGTIRIADEHIATQITLSEMSRLRAQIKPRNKLDRLAVVASLEGDEHMVGARVMADFLLMDGWIVHFLGANIPGSEIVEFSREKAADLVCLSITMEVTVPKVGETLNRFRSLRRSPKIMLGGPARVLELESVQNLKPDCMFSDVREAAREARTITGLLEAEAALHVFLKALGKRIYDKRKSKMMNQHNLAERSSLDRAYISSLENGKQNVTLGAVAKLAEALDMSIEELLVGTTRTM
jgi:methanogenic corrinoid protein MtbC1/DNA-binding Xre family transcriptional regulator